MHPLRAESIREALHLVVGRKLAHSRPRSSATASWSVTSTSISNALRPASLHPLDCRGQFVKLTADSQKLLGDAGVHAHFSLATKTGGFFAICLCIVPPVGKRAAYRS